MSKDAFSEFMNIIRKLRSEEGCPWDREQTHESLKTCLIEECYEAIEAINNKDMDNLCEELGDILLQVALHSVIAEEEDEFTVDKVISSVGEKMIRRHPHVFGEASVSDSKEVLINWEEIKKQEKQGENPVEEILSIPRAFPANIRAEKVLKKVTKLGGSRDVDAVFERLSKRMDGLKKAIKNGEDDRISVKYGNILLTMIDLSLILHLNAENSLTNATNKFINRFVDVFTLTERKGTNLYNISPTEQEVMWGDEE